MWRRGNGETSIRCGSKDCITGVGLRARVVPQCRKKRRRWRRAAGRGQDRNVEAGENAVVITGMAARLQVCVPVP